MVQKPKLFDQFPAVSTKEWKDKIHADLRGADFHEKLVWKTKEGFEVQPFYRKEDIENLKYINTLPGEFPYLRGVKIEDNSWLVRQNIEVTDYSLANSKALQLLLSGIDSLAFIITDPGSVNLENFGILLKDIHIESIEINFLCFGKAKEILDITSKIVTDKNLYPEKITGAIEADPIGRLVKNGNLCVPVEDGFDYLASLTDSAAVFPEFHTIHLNGSYFKNKEGGVVSELALAVSAGCEYLSQLTARGISADITAKKIRFSFGTGSDYFTEIAKLRAARLLWSAVVIGFMPAEPESARMNIHCVTSELNKTVDDPFTNMLRTQTEAMSAIIGGTDSLTVQPYDISFRKPDEFSERIARNQQLILKKESYFDKVVDPAAGSYYIENLTNMIAENAWKLFLEIEDQGGFLCALRSGYVGKLLSSPAAGSNYEKDYEAKIYR
jgi:methylmalonyl-CoA mutase